jgi:SnoaL-like domain
MGNANEVVAEYQQALGDRDFQAARALLKDDLRFKGPFEEFASADNYLKTVRGLWGIVQSVAVKHVSSAGDQVVVLYDMVTNTPAGTAADLRVVRRRRRQDRLDPRAVRLRSVRLPPRSAVAADASLG